MKFESLEKNKSIDECTKLFDINTFDNPKKASTYIHKAFEDDFNYAIDETLKDNISRVNLLDMMVFDRAYFEKDINGWSLLAIADGVGSAKYADIGSKEAVNISVDYLKNIISDKFNHEHLIDSIHYSRS